MKNIAITKDVQSNLSPSNVLQDLLDGNHRFVNGNSQATDNSALVNANYRRSISKSCSAFLYRFSRSS